MVLLLFTKITFSHSHFPAQLIHQFIHLATYCCCGRRGRTGGSISFSQRCIFHQKHSRTMSLTLEIFCCRYWMLPNPNRQNARIFMCVYLRLCMRSYFLVVAPISVRRIFIFPHRHPSILQIVNAHFFQKFYTFSKLEKTLDISNCTRTRKMHRVRNVKMAICCN